MESGVLELYVTGSLTSDEKADVERMALTYPEIRKELDEIERSLERYSETYAIEPDGEDLKTSILAAMLGAGGKSAEAAGPLGEAKVVALRPQTFFFYKYAFVACLALLLLSVGGLLLMYAQLQDSEAAFVALQTQNRQMATNATYMQQQLAEKDKIVSVFTDPDFQMVDLKGTSNAPAAAMKVAFNAKKKEVMIDMASLDMPENDQEHQYQLWAVVDGKPVDLGVFDKNPGDTGMKRMKEIDRAQTFAVTLEPRGGSVNPTLSQLMVAGNLSE